MRQSLLQEIFWNIRSTAARKNGMEEGSAGSYVRTSCKYREMAQRAVDYSYSKETPGSSEKSRSDKQRMELGAAVEKWKAAENEASI